MRLPLLLEWPLNIGVRIFSGLDNRLLINFVIVQGGNPLR
jgi:hypothetical protein